MSPETVNRASVGPDGLSDGAVEEVRGGGDLPFIPAGPVHLLRF